jgi:peptidoglycan/xylan/chitin deacetylase (PgdA/CDA1 family)
VSSTDITTCPDKLTWGLTYDDGPSLYTPDLLDFLNDKNLKTTFFVVGSRAISFPGLRNSFDSQGLLLTAVLAILQAEYMQGHQIAVHTCEQNLTRAPTH